MQVRARIPPRTRRAQLQTEQQHRSDFDLQQPLLSEESVHGRRGVLAHSAGPQQRGGSGLRPGGEALVLDRCEQEGNGTDVL